MSIASDVIARAQRFVDEGQPYTFGGKNQAMNKGNKHIVESLKNTYGTGSGHYGHILGDDKTNTGMNYKKYVNAESSPYVFIDCSGLTDVAFKAGGINIGAGSSNQNSNAKGKVARIDPKTNANAIRPGALLHRDGHVAVMGYDNKVIEAKGWKYGCVAGVTSVSSFTSAYNLSGSDGAAPVEEQKKQDLKVIGKATVVNVSSYLNVRPEAGTAKAPIGKLYNGNQVDVTGEAGDWYQIQYNGRTAYISKKYSSMTASSEPAKKEEVKPQTNETPSNTQTMYVTANSLNVRADSNANSAKLGALSKGTAITVLDTKNGWHKIAYKDSVGWVCGDYTSVNKPKASGNIATAYEDYQKYLANGLGGVQKDTSLKSYNNEEAAALNLIKAKMDKIDEISQKANLPRELVAGIWYREMSLRDGRYLHNGDPLGSPTTHVPVGIYFGTHQFVEAAVHALNMKRGLADQMGLNASSKDYAAMCAYCEAYNGFGYRNHGTASAYVAAGTDKYTGGMYVSDGKFSSTTKDTRVGVLRIFMMMAENFPR